MLIIKDYGIGWLFLDVIDAFDKDNEKLIRTSSRLKVECEHRISLATYKETLISFSCKAEKAEDQAQDLIIRISDLQIRLNSQP